MSISSVDALGFTSGVLGVISFALDHLPNRGPQGAKISIKLNQDGNGAVNMGGTLHRADGFDYQNGYLGTGGYNVHEDDGEPIEVTLDQSYPGQQTRYLDIIANDDAFCWSWITVKQHDENAPLEGGLTGDVAKYCGQSWYHGNQAAGRHKDGSLYIPECSWLDKDGNDGNIKSSSLKFNIYAYGDGAQRTANDGSACNHIIFNKQYSPISANPGKRSVQHSQIAATLIRSDIDGKTATELCESETSYGPDFIGPDGMFCDMHLKQLHPLCSSEDVLGCVDFDINNSTIMKKTTRAIFDLFKPYDLIEDWNQADVDAKATKLGV